MHFKDSPKLGAESSIFYFLTTVFWQWCKDITSGLRRLTFADNFQSFEVANLKIAATTEVTISNGFQGILPGVIPTKRIIVRQIGDGLVVDGPTAWNEKSVYLTNTGADEVTITVIFFL